MLRKSSSKKRASDRIKNTPPGCDYSIFIYKNTVNLGEIFQLNYDYFVVNIQLSYTQITVILQSIYSYFAIKLLLNYKRM